MVFVSSFGENADLVFRPSAFCVEPDASGITSCCSYSHHNGSTVLVAADGFGLYVLLKTCIWYFVCRHLALSLMHLASLVVVAVFYASGIISSCSCRLPKL